MAKDFFLVVVCVGKGLTFFIEMNILIINNVFQTAAWSCSWDLNSSHYMYAGLQVLNCVLFSFMRQLNSVVFFLFVCCFSTPHFKLVQNGMLMVFDMRQTARPMAEISGPTSNPIHTIHSVLHNSTLPSGVSTLLSASSVGLCQWNFGGSEER